MESLFESAKPVLQKKQDAEQAKQQAAQSGEATVDAEFKEVDEADKK